jgi:hypothetical protein
MEELNRLEKVRRSLWFPIQKLCRVRTHVLVRDCFYEKSNSDTSNGVSGHHFRLWVIIGEEFEDHLRLDG